MTPSSSSWPTSGAANGRNFSRTRTALCVLIVGSLLLGCGASSGLTTGRRGPAGQDLALLLGCGGEVTAHLARQVGPPQEGAELGADVIVDPGAIEIDRLPPRGGGEIALGRLGEVAGRAPQL